MRKNKKGTVYVCSIFRDYIFLTGGFFDEKEGIHEGSAHTVAGTGCADLCRTEAQFVTESFEGRGAAGMNRNTKILARDLLVLWISVTALVCAALNMHVSRKMLGPET